MSNVVRIPDAQSTPVAVASLPQPPQVAPAPPPPSPAPAPDVIARVIASGNNVFVPSVPSQPQPVVGASPSVTQPPDVIARTVESGQDVFVQPVTPPPDAIMRVVESGQDVFVGVNFPLIPGEGGNESDNNFGSWDIGDDPEAGDEPTDDELDAWDAEAAGGERTLSSAHPRPGTIIGFPYQGTHGKAFNIAGGSDNWQSENAVDVWLFPGTEITAVEHGIVSPGHWGYGLSGLGGRFAGYRLHIVGRSGRVYFYTHLAGLAVVKGQTVNVGEKIGDSGIANGVPHLHFAVSPPNLPQAYVQGAFNIGHRTSVGTSGRTGKVPQKPKPQGSTNQAWRNLLAVFRDDIPAAASEAEAVIRRTRKAIT